MVKPIPNPRTLSPVFLFLFTLVLTFLFAFPWVNAQEPPKPKPWQIDGIMAAKDDEHDQVKGYAFWVFSGYKPQDLKSVVKKPEDIAQKAVTILKDDSVDSDVRGSAAEALGNLGETAQPYVQDIATILKDDSVDQYVRGSAARALGNLGETAQPYVQDILNFLKDDRVDSDVRSSAAEALRNIRKLKRNEVLVVLNNVYEPNTLDDKLGWRFLTYFLSGGTDEVKTLLKWLGNPQDTPTQLNYADGKQMLNIFLDIWEPCQDLERLRKDLAEQIAIVAANKEIPWRWQDIGLLKHHHRNLQAVYPTKATAVESAINDLEFWRWVFTARNIIIAHIIFWLALIFAYPKSPQIQAIFFWNPWVRKILGMGYVGFLLTWVPFLRRKLFEPFKPSLLADAELNDFDDFAYFPESKVKVLESGEIQAITAAIPSIQGQILVVGDSGLGKSMFLHHLVKHSRRIVVYLPAQNCQDGVIAAIQAKLHGQAQDDQFLKSLVYSGAIDICIDALNEVSADTRSQIKQFVQTYFQGNIIITTQPLEWVPPSTAKRYDLQPLEPPQIEQFLLSRRRGLPKNALVKGIEYEKACKSYLAAALNPQQSPEELEGVQRILSNPMDLTLVSLMLSQGKHPNLFRLQEQHYQMMAVEYQQEWHHEFPLNKFSEAVYQMRLKDEKALPADEFNQELSSLEDEKYKMVVSRQWDDEKGNTKKEWYFRHDKIIDFFIVQTFLGDSYSAEKRLREHIGDSRFRGVYFLLATLLAVDEAKQLRETLIQYAADTKDHTVSDKFVQLLRTR